MAKWFGKVFYSNTEEVETAPGVWEDKPVIREYAGDLIRNHKRFEQVQQVNDNISLQNEISMVADPYAIQNFQYIRAVEIMGTLWKVTAVDVQYPRLILSVGGVYNGTQA